MNIIMTACPVKCVKDQYSFIHFSCGHFMWHFLYTRWCCQAHGPILVLTILWTYLNFCRLWHSYLKWCVMISQKEEVFLVSLPISLFKWETWSVRILLSFVTETSLCQSWHSFSFWKIKYEKRPDLGIIFLIFVCLSIFSHIWDCKKLFNFVHTECW